jgi:hypothetical protein
MCARDVTVTCCCHCCCLLTGRRIRLISGTDGTISTWAGSTQGFSGDGATIAAARFAFPYSVSINAASRLMAVADFNNNRVRLINMTSGAVSTLAGGGASTGEDVSTRTARLAAPWAVAWSSRGDLAIADGNRVRMVFVSTNRTIRTIAGDATATGFSGDGGPASAALLQGAVSLAYDARDNLFVGVSGAVRRIDAVDATISTVVGTGNSSTGVRFTNNMPVSLAGIMNPRGLAVDANGALFVADNSLSRVRKVWCP